MITQNGADLSSTPGVAYQWFLNGVFIANATAQTYSPTVNGDYTVLVVDADNCTETSAPFAFLSAAINAASIAQAFTVAPNPTNGPITVNIAAPLTPGAYITLTNALGQVVSTTRVVPGTNVLDVQAAPDEHRVAAGKFHRGGRDRKDLPPCGGRFG